MAGSCEHGDESSCSIKFRHFVIGRGHVNVSRKLCCIDMFIVKQETLNATSLN